MSPKVEFELADNAFDYIVSAAEHAKRASPRDLKYAILHLFAGIELLLKARLYVHDWKLIFASSKKADQAALKTGDFRSVDFETACERLATEVSVSVDDATKNRLNELRKIRNKVQHFEVAVDAKQVTSLLAFGTSFVIDFTNVHLPELLAPRDETLNQIYEHLRDFKHFVAERFKEVRGDLEAAATKIECPRCWQETLIIGDYDDPTCPFCGAEFDAEEMAEFSDTGSAERCPTCERQTASVRIAGDEGMIWFCYGCGEDGKYRRCPRCDNLMWEEEGLCSTCLDEFMRKND
jgi:hypothetical protein